MNQSASIDETVSNTAPHAHNEERVDTAAQQAAETATDDVSWDQLLAGIKQGSATWLKLVQTEAQLAVDTIARLHALSLSMAAIAVTGWMGLMATIGALAWKQGMALEMIFGVATLMCLGVLYGLRQYHRKLLRSLGFQASLRQLGLGTSGGTAAEDSPSDKQ